MLEAFLRDYGPCWCERIAQVLQFCWLCIHDVNIPSQHNTTQRCSGGLRSGDWSVMTFFTTLRWFELYDMVPYRNGAAIWRCLHWRHKEINRINRHQWAVAFKWSPVGTKGPKVCHIHHTITPLEARLAHSLILFIPNSVARFWRAMQCATL